QRLALLGTCIPIAAAGLMVALGATPLLPGLLWGAAVAAVLGSAAAHLLKPLDQLARQARALADNPLSQCLYTGRPDDFGAIAFALHSREAETGAVIGRIADAAEQLNLEAAQLNDTFEQSNRAARLQRGEIEQLTGAMQEMTTSIQDVARNAQLGASATQAADAETEQG